MIEIITGATILILFIMIIRRLTKGKISMRLRYALWIMVVLRLILPVSIGSSPFSVMNVQEAIRSYVAADMQESTSGIAREGGRQVLYGMENGAERETEYTAKITEYIDGLGIGTLPDVMEDTRNLTGAEALSSGYRPDVKNVKIENGWMFYIIAGIWIAGIVAVGSCMAAGQIRFVSCLRRMRKEVPLCKLPDIWEKRMTERRIHVYTIQGLPGPCMTGKSIYVDPQLCDGQDGLLYVLAHEYAHAVQGDALWAAARCVLCAVYWFHPLVWMAAYEAKQDSELACDERAIELLGEAERFAYGRMLLDMVSDGHNGIPLAGAVLMMNDCAKKMKERVYMIAEKRKKSGIAVGIIILTTVLACGCAFTGAQQNDEGMAAEEQRQQEEAMRAEAEEIDRLEQEAIQQRLDELETMEQQTQQKIQAARATVETDGQMELEEDIRREYLEAIEQLEEEETIIRKHFDEIQEEWYRATGEEFGSLLDHIEDDALETAVSVDSLERTECYDYLYKGAKCPIEDGTWCLLYQDKEYDTAIYGLYTEKYGCRGVKMKIGGDVNTWDMLWRLPLFERGIEVMVLEVTEEGLPRSFAIKVCVENTGTSEVWRLYLADRYDTGTIDLYVFEEENCRKQFRDRVGFSLNEEEKMVIVTCEEDVTGAIDISDYADYTVDEVIWDGSVMGYSLGDDNTITLRTCIGLKTAETGEVLYRGLSVINCPVDIGAWGEREFMLGTPSVDTDYVNAALQ